MFCWLHFIPAFI